MEPKIVLITTPNRSSSEKLSCGIVEARLAACVNIVPGVLSVYWWQGCLQKEAEELLIVKTALENLDSLQRLVFELHPYDTPEFIVLSPETVAEKYLDWMKSVLKT